MNSEKFFILLLTVTIGVSAAAIGLTLATIIEGVTGAFR